MLKRLKTFYLFIYFFVNQFLKEPLKNVEFLNVLVGKNSKVGGESNWETW